MPRFTYEQQNHLLDLYRLDKRAALSYLFTNSPSMYNIRGEKSIHIWQEYESVLTPGRFYGSYKYLVESDLDKSHKIIWNNDKPGIYWTYAKYNPRTYRLEKYQCAP